jgi:hypothetical protein
MGRLREAARDERGMTLVEVLVATATGVVIMLGITTAMIISMRQVQRISTHVEANQRARMTMSKIVDQLHSACIAYDIPPIRSDSTATTLSFVHQAGSGVSLTPVLSKISLTGTTLSQSNYPYSSGTAPAWVFNGTASSPPEQLLTGVSPASIGAPIFSYYGYSGGAISSSPFSATPSLEAEAAGKTVQVNIAFKAAPVTTQSGDTNAPAAVQSSVFLRMSPASFATGSVNAPCQ